MYLTTRCLCSLTTQSVTVALPVMSRENQQHMNESYVDEKKTEGP